MRTPIAFTHPTRRDQKGIVRLHDEIDVVLLIASLNDTGVGLVGAALISAAFLTFLGIGRRGVQA